MLHKRCAALAGGVQLQQFAAAFAVRQAVGKSTSGKQVEVSNVFDRLSDAESERLTAILVGLGPCFVKLG